MTIIKIDLLVVVKRIFNERLEAKMNRKAIFQYIDGFILFCLCVLVIFLPIAHTETIRAFSIGIPAG
ncbi:MAG TPA: hypothetical protein VEH09_03060, partial [Thermodesulfobacteriota bacterium]|nr:hypothetical protein [Thermodesulfobacteriota bacterium]